MKAFDLTRPGQGLSILCLGAHADDIEIGVGGTILGWIAAGVHLDVTWCVLSAPGPRGAEAEASAAALLEGASRAKVLLAAFRDGYFPYQGGDIKDWIEALKTRGDWDVIFTHRRDDGHQDHRHICQLTWNSFRDHLILEYEVPKWDGDLGQPNVYMPLSAAVLERKIDLLHAHFGSQRAKHWFDGETFRALARLRGMECRAPERYAEGFVARKLRLG